MAYVPAPGVVEVIQYFSSGAANALNRMHVMSATPWTYERLNDLIDVFEDWENATGNLHRCVEVATTGFRATDLTSLASPMAFRGANILGEILTPAVSFNTSFALKLDTGLRGRGRNGRVFFFGLSEEGCDAYLIQGTYANAIKDSYEGLREAVEAFEDCKLAVLHKQRDGVELNPMEASEVVRVTYTDLFLDSQRDRLPNHKRHKRSP